MGVAEHAVASPPGELCSVGVGVDLRRGGGSGGGAAAIGYSGGGGGGGYCSSGGSAHGIAFSSADDSAALRRRCEMLQAQLASAEASLRASQEQSRHWQKCVQDMFNGLLLNPRMNAKYELKVSKVLERAISRLDQIEAVRYVKCSFPSVRAEAPQMKLLRWVSLEESEWDVAFAPCWKIELCLEGRSMMLPFKLLVRVGAIRMRGEVRLSFPPEHMLMHTLLSFNQMPNFDMSIDSEVSLGMVPMPLQRGASALIRHELRKWMKNKAVAPHAIRLKRTEAGVASAPGGGQSGAPHAAPHAAAMPHAAGEHAAGSAGADGYLASASAYLYGGTSAAGAAAADAAHPTGDEQADGWGGDAHTATDRVPPHAPRPHLPPPPRQGASKGVSDEELRHAILAALIKHDNPRVGVGRKKGGVFGGRSKR